MKSFLQSIWSYRGFILGSVKREFQSKYRNSLLGAAWMILNPLAMIFVYTVIFSEVMRAKLPGTEGAFAYSIYLCAGTITWALFAEVVMRGQNVFLDNSNLLKKINFPRINLPIIIVLSSLINFFIIFVLFLVFLCFSGGWPGLNVLAILPVLAVQILFSVGLAINLGVLNVFFRDVGQFFGIFMQFWFWFTPIVYPASILPLGVRGLMEWNPMFPLINAYHQIFVTKSVPEWSLLSYPLVLAIVLCVCGLLLFRKHAAEMVDEL